MKRTLHAKGIRWVNSGKEGTLQPGVFSALSFFRVLGRLSLTLVVLVSSALIGCSKKPTSEACKAAIVHVLEVQLDSPEFQKMQEQVINSGPEGGRISAEQQKENIKFLKSQLPSQVMPEAVSQCVERMKADDIECTMTATTVKDLVEKCNWKVTSGPKGSALGF